MIRSAATMPGGGDSPALGARERDGRRRAAESASARDGAGVNVSAAMRRRGRAAFTLPTWFNIAATIAVAVAIAVGVLLQG